MVKTILKHSFGPWIMDNTSGIHVLQLSFLSMGKSHTGQPVHTDSVRLLQTAKLLLKASISCVSVVLASCWPTVAAET